jgi:cytochrome P450
LVPGPFWRQQRKLITPMLHFQTLRDMFGIMVRRFLKM